MLPEVEFQEAKPLEIVYYTLSNGDHVGSNVKFAVERRKVMKRKSMYLLICTVILFAACNTNTGDVSKAPGGGYGCFKDEKDGSGMCLTIRGDEETVKMGGVMPITITITSDKDETGLLLTIYTSPNFFIKDVEFPEQTIIEEQYTKTWKFDIKAQQELVYHGFATFSDNQEKDNKILVSVFDPARGVLVDYSMLVAFREDIGRVYYSGEVPPPLNPDLTPAYDEATRNFYLTQDALATPSP